MVATRLAAEFGWQPRLHDPELAVAKGAAVFALSRVVYRMQQEAKQRSATPAEGERAASDVVDEVARQVGISGAEPVAAGREADPQRAAARVRGAAAATTTIPTG